MAVVPIDIDVQLASDHLIDVVILQWWTELEHGPRGFAAIPAQVIARKTAEFDRLAVWLRDEFEPVAPLRPLFIVVPEVSFPPGLLGHAENIIKALGRPCVFIAGLHHLAWQEYTNLLAEYQHMPAGVNWSAGGTQGNFVNAAAIFVHTGTSGGPIEKFLQLKIHPFVGESPQLFCGSHTLLFRSQNQTSGSRLNFAIKICSDFVDPDVVRTFRREVETSAPATQLDLTFVLQYQDDPEDSEFKHGVKAYFQPPIGMVETSKGAVIFANAGNESRGRSSQFGGSRVDVQYSQRFRMTPDMPCPTCVGDDQSDFDHQALILRDSGPCVYRLTFKPIYLVDPAPGRGDDHPFHPGECAFLDEQGPGLLFHPLQPICHWIESEWRDDEPELLATISWGQEGDATQQAYREFVRDAHKSSRVFWIAAMGTREIEVRNGIQHYTKLLSMHQQNPSNQAEPWRWGQATSTAVGRFMRVLTLLRLGLTAAMPMNFPTVLRVRHAMLGDTMGLTLLWGNGDRHPTQMLSNFQNLKDNYGVGEFIGRKWMLVLVEPGTPLTADDLASWKESNITQGTVTNPAGDRTQAVGDVVRVEQDLEVLSASDLISSLTTSRDSVALQARLRQILEPRFV